MRCILWSFSTPLDFSPSDKDQRGEQLMASPPSFTFCLLTVFTEHFSLAASLLLCIGDHVLAVCIVVLSGLPEVEMLS